MSASSTNENGDAGDDCNSVNDSGTYQNDQQNKNSDSNDDKNDTVKVELAVNVDDRDDEVDEEYEVTEGGDENPNNSDDEQGDTEDKPMVNSIEVAAFEAAMEDGVKMTPSNKNLPPGFHTKKTYNIKPPSSLRRGKWTQEEEDFANKIIQDFKHGKLPLAEGTTLRTFLSKVLNCDPMRISKKFVGKNCVGKQVFRGSHSVAVENFDYNNSELAELEKKFFSKLSQKSVTTSKSHYNGSSSSNSFHGGVKNPSYSNTVRTPISNADKESKLSLDINGLVYPGKMPGLGSSTNIGGISSLNNGLSMPYIAGNTNDFLLNSIVNSPVNIANMYSGHHLTGVGNLNNSLYHHNYNDYLYSGSNINMIKSDHSLIPSMSNRSLSSSINNSESDFLSMNKLGSNSNVNSSHDWGSGGGMKNLYSAITGELASMETATDDNVPIAIAISQDNSPRFNSALSALQSLSSAALHEIDMLSKESTKTDSSDDILGKGKRERRENGNDDADNDVGYSYDEMPDSLSDMKKEFNSKLPEDLDFPPRSSSVSDFLYMVKGVNNENNSQFLSGELSPDSYKLKIKKLSDDN